MYEALNEKYIHLFSMLFASRSVLPKKQLSQMEDALMSAYKRELTVLTGNISLDVSREMFELKRKLHLFTPRKFLFYKNRVAKVLLEQCREEFEAYLASLSAQPEEAMPPNEDQTALVPVCTSLTVK